MYSDSCSDGTGLTLLNDRHDARWWTPNNHHAGCVVYYRACSSECHYALRFRTVVENDNDTLLARCPCPHSDFARLRPEFVSRYGSEKLDPDSRRWSNLAAIRVC